MKATLLQIAFAAALASPLAHACGACDEDKIAATYDYATVTQAAAAHRVVVFGGIDGAVDARAASVRVARAAAQVRGVQRNSVRTSSAPAAFSFVLDPAVQSPDRAVAEVQRRARMPGLKLALIEVAP